MIDSDQPTPIEAFVAAFDEAAQDRAEAAAEPRRIHDDGEPHHAETCPHCQADAIAKSLRDLANALADALTPMLDAFRTAMEQTKSPNGPQPRRQRAPRDHPSNTGLAAHSRASSQTQRNALRRL